MRMTMMFAPLVLAAAAASATPPPIDVDAYRARGQAAVDELMKQPNVDHALLDQVCKQKDCAASGLYWYTDLDEAKRVAQRERKPILSLRLLGNLDEELSCANSRFFRTILYANNDVSSFLRANFILHWKSERPVPKVTIDFGDGRTMVRTLTGNSIHYVLDERGMVVDALPGLYDPATFVAALRDIVVMSRTSPVVRMEYHTQRAAMSEPERNKNLLVAAELLATSKSILEVPVLAKGWGVGAVSIRRDPGPAPIALDRSSLALIRSKSHSSDEEFARMIAQLEKSLATDTKRNQEELRPFIHRWLATQQPSDLESLNRRVYDELFLTPKSDAWLGLRSADVYSAIEGDGIITTTAADPAGTSTASPSRALAQSARSRQ